MTTYNTGNPIGSTDPRDLKDNAENLDELVNSTSKDEHTDRLGVQRKTWNGMEEDFQADQGRRENEHETDQARREDEFDTDQASREERFNLFIANSGYQFSGDYEAGIQVNEYNEVVRDSSGNLWRLSTGTSLPYTTTGAGLPENDAFVPLGDADLRQDLAGEPANGGGALRVRGSTVYVDTIADLKLVPTADLIDGQQASVREYATGNGVGGGQFYWDASSTQDEDEGTIFEVSGVATGRWKRVGASGVYLATWFGAVPDGDSTDVTAGTDNSPAQIAADEAAYNNGAKVVLWPPGTYRFTDTLQRKVPHYGEPSNGYTSQSTNFMLDSATAKTWLEGRGVSSQPQRSHDIRNINFRGGGSIHTLFDANGYRLEIENCLFDGFDVAFDVDGVYVWWKNCHWSNCTKGVYPRALRVSGAASTMFSFDHCVFLGNVNGFHLENRGLGNTTEDDDLLNLRFHHCGFEQNSDCGFKIEQRAWYFNTTNCWSESNTTAGPAITADASSTDWVDVSSRWDDTIIDETAGRTVTIGGASISYPAANHEFKNEGSVRSVISSSMHVKSDGSISYSNFPATASISSGVLTIVPDSTISRPMINVTPVARNQQLSYSVSFENTSSASAVADFAVVNEIKIRCFDPQDPATAITPSWYAVDISWPSGENLPS